jgi:hypothetical protein
MSYEHTLKSFEAQSVLIFIVSSFVACYGKFIFYFKSMYLKCHCERSVAIAYSTGRPCISAVTSCLINNMVVSY